MILTYRRPDPPDTHVLTMVNNVIEVLNYVIAAHPPPLNYVIADNGGLMPGPGSSASATWAWLGLPSVLAGYGAAALRMNALVRL
jgi:hypothetical protein